LPFGFLIGSYFLRWKDVEEIGGFDPYTTDLAILSDFSKQVNPSELKKTLGKIATYSRYPGGEDEKELIKFIKKHFEYYLHETWVIPYYIMHQIPAPHKSFFHVVKKTSDEAVLVFDINSPEGKFPIVWMSFNTSFFFNSDEI
jgi:hypothetical protein